MGEICVEFLCLLSCGRLEVCKLAPTICILPLVLSCIFLYMIRNMSYTKLRDGQPVDFPDGDTEPGFVTTLAEKKRRWYIYLISCGALSLLLGLSVGAYVHRHLHKAQSGMEWAPHATSSNCHHPVIRREWRSLSVEEKDDYLDAVRCLRDIPSRIGQSQSLYDDFPWIHYRIGDYCESLFPMSHLWR